MLFARARSSSLLLVLLALTACTQSRAPRDDEKPRTPDVSSDAGTADASNDASTSSDAAAPLEIWGSDCPRSNLSEGWKLPPQPQCRTSADCGSAGICVGLPGDRCEPAADGGACSKVLVSTFCSYEVCRTNADCPADSACVCSAGRSGGHYCVIDGCQNDAACDPGQQCRLDESIGGVAPQWHCSTPSDTCRSHADCADGVETGACGYDVELHHWRCGGITIVD